MKESDLLLVEKKILELLAKGKKQSELPSELDRQGVTPNSLRYIELRLKELKNRYNCKTLTQLIYKATKKGII